jgi:hypothetical protein
MAQVFGGLAILTAPVEAGGAAGLRVGKTPLECDDHRQRCKHKREELRTGSAHDYA